MGYYPLFVFIYGYYIDKGLVGDSANVTIYHTIDNQLLVGAQYSPALIPIRDKYTVNPTEVVNFITAKMETNNNRTTFSPSEIFDFLNANSRLVQPNEFQRFYTSYADGVKTFDEEVLKSSVTNPECLDEAKDKLSTLESEGVGGLTRPCEPKFYVKKTSMSTW